MSLFANFSCLDELIQVVYQDVNRFVVLSNVSSGEWAIHLGLTGEGRWWHGRWREADVTNLVGSNPSDFLLETFAEKLADSILKGDLYITNFDAGKDINITLAPTSKKPMNVALEVMDSKESAIYTCRVLLDIALQAQKRKCHLHPDFISVQPPDPSSSATSSNPKPVSSPASRTEEIIEPKTKAGSSNDKKRKELELVKPESKEAAPPRALKGASLANPTKKARRYQPVQFASDDEE